MTRLQRDVGGVDYMERTDERFRQAGKALKTVQHAAATNVLLGVISSGRISSLISATRTAIREVFSSIKSRSRPSVTLPSTDMNTDTTTRGRRVPPREIPVRPVIPYLPAAPTDRTQIAAFMMWIVTESRGL